MLEIIKNKIITIDRIPGILTNSFREKHKIVFTNGCFDIIHRGHIHYLSLASQKGDILIIGLNSDDSVRKLKGAKRPVKDQQTRAIILASMQFVHYVIMFEEDTPLNLIKAVRPDILIKGGDYRIEDIVGYNEVKLYGGIVETIPFLEGYSSTDIINKLQ